MVNGYNNYPQAYSSNASSQAMYTTYSRQSNASPPQHPPLQPPHQYLHHTYTPLHPPPVEYAPRSYERRPPSYEHPPPQPYDTPPPPVFNPAHFAPQPVFPPKPPTPQQQQYSRAVQYSPYASAAASAPPPTNMRAPPPPEYPWPPQRAATSGARARDPNGPIVPGADQLATWRAGAVEVFRRFDQDCGGYLDLQEFMDALRGLSVAMAYHEAIERFIHCDENEDGRITEEEFVKIYVEIRIRQLAFEQQQHHQQQQQQQQQQHQQHQQHQQQQPQQHYYHQSGPA